MLKALLIGAALGLAALALCLTFAPEVTSREDVQALPPGSLLWVPDPRFQALLADQLEPVDASRCLFRLRRSRC